MNINNLFASHTLHQLFLIYYFLHNRIVFKRSRSFFKKDKATHNLERISNNLTFDSLITFESLFLFLCVFIGYIRSHDMTERIYFQNHSGSKHLYGDFCRTFAEITSVSNGIPLWRDGMKNFPALYKRNLVFVKKLMYAYHLVYGPSRFYSVQLFI